MDHRGLDRKVPPWLCDHRGSHMVTKTGIKNVEIKEAQPELVWGGENIAKVIGRTRRITFSLLDKGELPAKKVGGRWVAERNKLISFLTDTVA